jgi:hypothetical protein
MAVGPAAAAITETFDSDPGWTGLNNRAGGNDFGFSNTDNCGQGAGEMGGLVDRYNGPAYYADTTSITEALTEADNYGASGSFYLRESEDTADANQDTYIGYFSTTDSVNSGRPRSLALRIREKDRQGGVDYFRVDINLRRKYDTTSTTLVLAEGERFDFSFDYDPDGGTNGFGSFSAMISDESGALLLDEVVDIAAEAGETPASDWNDWNHDAFGMWTRDRGEDYPAGENDYEVYADNLTYVPEPATLGLLGVGVIGLVRRRRRG